MLFSAAAEIPCCLSLAAAPGSQKVDELCLGLLFLMLFCCATKAVLLSIEISRLSVSRSNTCIQTPDDGCLPEITWVLTCYVLLQQDCHRYTKVYQACTNVQTSEQHCLLQQFLALKLLLTPAAARAALLDVRLSTPHLHTVNT